MRNKVVYEFLDDNGIAVAIGMGSLSRFNTLEHVRKTGKISSKIHNKITMVLLLNFRMSRPGRIIAEGLTKEEAEAMERDLHSKRGGNVGSCRDLMIARLDELGITDEEDRWMFLNWAKHGDQLSTGRLESDIPPRIKELIIKVLGNIF